MPDLLTLKIGFYYLLQPVVQPIIRKQNIPLTWNYPGRITDSHIDDSGRSAVFQCEKGRITINALSPRIFKVLIEREGDPPYFSASVVYREKENLALVNQDNLLKVSLKDTNSLEVLVDPSNTTLKFRFEDYVLHYEKKPAGFNKNWVCCRKYSPAPELYAGFGEKTGGIFKNNKRLIMWNTDDCRMGKNSDPVYQSFPLQIALRKDGTTHAVFYDSVCYSLFKIGHKKHESLFISKGGPLCYYVLAGPSLKDVVQQYAELTGRYYLPPLWVLGHHHSRWKDNESQQDLLTLAKEFRKHNLPCDVLHIDIGHMDQFKCFTWDRERFPEPGELIKQMHRLGFKAVVITDPGIKRDHSWEIYNEGVKNGYFCRDKKAGVYHAPVWPGASAFVDFTFPPACKWWGKLYEDYRKIGVDGFWNDMNEPSTFDINRTLPDSIVHQGGNNFPETIHARVHNLYGFLMAKATYEGITKMKKDERPFLFCRSAFAGIQRYASTWTGDNSSNWTHLAMSIPMLLNMGLSGQVMTGADIGGFWGKPDKELFIRWMQAGTFYPFHRNHTAKDTAPQEIWHFGEDAGKIVKKFLTLRYSLLPYLYTYLREGCTTGMPLMRPLFLEFSHDSFCYEKTAAETQFLSGPYLLIAPVLKAGKRVRKVYLPQGACWYDWWTGLSFSGGKEYEIKAPLSDTPVFVKAGSVLPMASDVNCTDELYDKALILTVFPDRQIEGKVYIDDGITKKYLNGNYSLIKIEGKEENKNKLLLTLHRIGGNLKPVFYKHPFLILRIILKEQKKNVKNIFINNHSIIKNKKNWKITDKWLEITVKKFKLPVNVKIIQEPV